MGDNIWITRHLKRKLFWMPTSYSGEDKELEYEWVEGRRIPLLLDYWYSHLRHGGITVQEHRAITAIILFEFDTQATI